MGIPEAVSLLTMIRFYLYAMALQFYDNACLYKVGQHRAEYVQGGSIVVKFDKVGKKNMGYEFCMEKKLLEFI